MFQFRHPMATEDRVPPPRAASGDPHHVRSRRVVCAPKPKSEQMNVSLKFYRFVYFPIAFFPWAYNNNIKATFYISRAII